MDGWQPQRRPRPRHIVGYDVLVDGPETTVSYVKPSRRIEDTL